MSAGAGAQHDAAGEDVPPRRRDRHPPRLGRSLGLTLLSAVLPGAGLTRTRSRRLGWAVLVVALGVVGWVGWRLLTRGVTATALSVVGSPGTLRTIAAGLVVAGVVWCAAIVLTAVQTRPAGLGRRPTRALALVTTALVIAVATGTFKVAEYATITTDTVSAVFKPQPVVPGATTPPGAVVSEGEDPWAETPRVNILLLGSDAGVNRTGTRTDSMVVASIDTKSGDTALISLPRNLERVPLPKASPLRELYPSGVYGRPYCIRAQADPADRCYLNAIWNEVDEYRANHPGSYSGEAPGREETRAVVGAVTGLRIDHLVVIDLAGFEQLIDAMGGVEINVKRSAGGTVLPIGGKLNEATGTYYGVTGRLEPGRRVLKGYDALWYARTRAADTDSYRQARQRCVVQAVVQQVNPAAMLRRYPDLARIAKENIYTDISAENLTAYVDLVERVQQARISSVSLTAAERIYSGNPDYRRLRALVKKAITPAPAPTRTPKTPSTAKTPNTAKAPTASPSPSSTTQTGLTPLAEYSVC